MSDTSTAHQVDDIVTVDDQPGLSWVVRKINAKTYSLDQVDADGLPFPECQRIRAPHNSVHKAAEVTGLPVTAGMLKAWLRDVPDSMPVLVSRDDAGNTHAGLSHYTEALASPAGDLGYQDAIWDGDHQDADLLDLIKAEGGQRVLVLVPQV